MSNAAAPAAYVFDVIRRCDPGECEHGCNCDRVTVNVDVDELTEVEIAHFRAHGTAAQRAEIATYFAPEVPMSKPVSKCSAPVSCCLATGRPFDACPCDNCSAARLPSTCPPGCGCLVCLVDSLSANPPARRAA